MTGELVIVGGALGDVSVFSDACSRGSDNTCGGMHGVGESSRILDAARVVLQMVILSGPLPDGTGCDAFFSRAGIQRRAGLSRGFDDAGIPSWGANVAQFASDY